MTITLQLTDWPSIRSEENAYQPAVPVNNPDTPTSTQSLVTLTCLKRGQSNLLASAG